MSVSSNEWIKLIIIWTCRLVSQFRWSRESFIHTSALFPPVHVDQEVEANRNSESFIPENLKCATYSEWKPEDNPDTPTAALSPCVSKSSQMFLTESLKEQLSLDYSARNVTHKQLKSFDVDEKLSSYWDFLSNLSTLWHIVEISWKAPLTCSLKVM